MCIVERERTSLCSCEVTGNQSITLAMPKESAEDVNSALCVLAKIKIWNIEEVQ